MATRRSTESSAAGASAGVDEPASAVSASAGIETEEKAPAQSFDPQAIAARVRARRRGKGGEPGARKKTSKPFRDLERADRHLARAAHRLARAAEKGIAAYREGQTTSAAERRDGAILDQPLNVAEGMAVALGEAARAPVDVARAMTTKSGRRVVRVAARLLLAPLSR